MMVFASHLEFIIGGTYIYEEIFKEGYIGVSFFFILSGFIISYKYASRLKNQTLSSKEFYLARVARIYPLHLLCLLLAIPLAFNSLGSIDGWVKLFTQLSLTQSFIPNESIYFSFNGPAWSLSNEMFFYLLFPLLAIGMSGKKIMWTALLGFLIILVLMHIIPAAYYHDLFYIHPAFRLFDFIFGMMLYHIFRKYRFNGSRSAFTLLEVLSIALFLLFFLFHSFVFPVFRYSIYYWIPVGFMILIFSYQKGIISRILSHKYLVFLGEISFGIYLFHQLVLRYFDSFNSRFLEWENPLLIISLNLILIIFISSISYLKFEKPVNQFIRHK